MQSVPFALSVHHFISSVGADAGFASLIGLALLILLYFAQARETATLRRRADDAGLRVQDLEGQMYELAGQLASMPEPEISVRAAGPRANLAAAGAARRAGGVPVAVPPFAPVGVGAPALASATRLIPDPVLPVAEPAPAGGESPGEGAAVDGAPVQADGAAVEGPAPATVAGGNGSSRQYAAASIATAQRAPQAPARGPAGPVRPGGGGRPSAGRPPGGPARPGPAPRRFVPPEGPPPRRSGAGRVLAIILGTLVAAAVVVALLFVTGNLGSSSKKKTTASNAAASRRTTRKAVFNPTTVTVAVLNGTDVSGLAARVASNLAKYGYRKGAITNASDQATTSSVVQYMAPADRTDAMYVAGALKLTASAVGPIDQGTKAIACPPGQACTAAVVVTVGSDIANRPAFAAQ
jgi:hypothetical protein